MCLLRHNKKFKTLDYFLNYLTYRTGGYTYTPHTHTIKRREKRKLYNTETQIKSEKFLMSRMCGKRENHCTPVKSRSKIQAKEVHVEREV